jgi:DNA repair protein RecN (Recombination protein N)
MLLSIDISNFALIDELSTEFTPGLNVLTGETGAGKSIIIGALMLLLGERASMDQIRTGEDSATVSGLFGLDGDSRVREILDEYDIPWNDDNTLVVFREVSRSGRNKCRVNDKLCTLSVLKLVGECLVDVHGQYQHQSLLSSDTHIDFVDEYGGETLLAARSFVSNLHDELRARRNELRKYSGDIHERTRQIELLRFQLQEIESAQLKPNEDEELYRERKILSNAETIRDNVEKAYAMMVNSGLERPSMDELLGVVIELLEKVSELDSSLSPILESARGAFYTLQEVSRSLRVYKDDFDVDVERASIVEQRIAEIAGLKRKYGNTIDDIFTYYKRTEQELDDLENCKETAERIEREIHSLQTELYDAASKLSEMRRNIIPVLEEKVTEELASLSMENTVFKIQIRKTNSSSLEECKVSERGIDEVEFLISPNPGEELKPLSRIASGGEMSRIMLALKTVLAAVDKVSTLVFDEIDVGIGGRTASVVANRLGGIGKSKQVICITHLPQIAAFAESHYHIQKDTVKNRTFTTLSKLTEHERLIELAKMLGGSENLETALQHARELVNLARS